MGAKHAAKLVVLAALWGASFLFIRVAAPVLGPFVLCAARVLIAGTALLPVVVSPAVRQTLVTRWRGLLLLGAINAVLPFALIAYAELRITASLAALLNATIPMFTALIAALQGVERLTRRKLVGLALGFVGVAIVVGWSPVRLTVPVGLAIGAVLLAAVCYGCGSVYTRMAFADAPPAALALGQQLAAGALLVPFAAATMPSQPPPPSVLLAVLMLGLASTALAYVLYFGLVRALGPTGANTVTLLVPFWGLLWARLVLGEPIGRGALTGLGVIVLSLVCITGVSVRALRLGPASHAEKTTSR